MRAAEVFSIDRRTSLQIHDEAMSIARDLKSSYLRMFEVLLVVERRQMYLEFEITSLKEYCKELLGLSNYTANDFVIVVRKALEVPELADAVRAGRTTISKARKICPVLTVANHKEWIELAANCSCREIERTVALANPRAAVVETLKFVAGDVLELNMAVSAEWAELLTRTKDLMSQKSRRAVSSEEALFALMSEYCRKSDPVLKAARIKTANAKPAFEARLQKSSSVESDRGRLSPQVRRRPASVERAVDLRDGGRCTYVDANGKRCEARRWLEKHHIVEFAKGGSHEVSNLETLCSGHHKIRHLHVAPLSRDKGI